MTRPIGHPTAQTENGKIWSGIQLAARSIETLHRAFHLRRNAAPISNLYRSSCMDIQAFVPDIEARFLRYVRIDTQADESSPSIPSTAIQFNLLNLLADELRELGADEVTIADY